MTALLTPSLQVLGPALVQQKMGAQAALFVPRPEFDMVGRAADERLKGLEDSRSWFIKLLITQWVAGFGGVGTLIAMIKRSPDPSGLLPIW